MVELLWCKEKMGGGCLLGLGRDQPYTGCAAGMGKGGLALRGRACRGSPACFRGGEAVNPTLPSRCAFCRAAAVVVVVQVRRGFGKLRGTPAVLLGPEGGVRGGSLMEGFSLGG